MCGLATYKTKRWSITTADQTSACYKRRSNGDPCHPMPWVSDTHEVRKFRKAAMRFLQGSCRYRGRRTELLVQHQTLLAPNRIAMLQQQHTPDSESILIVKTPLLVVLGRFYIQSRPAFSFAASLVSRGYSRWVGLVTGHSPTGALGG